MTSVVVPRPTTLGLVAVAVVALAMLAVGHEQLALLACAALVLVVLVATAPAFLMAMCLPLAYAYWRVGPSALNMSGADAALVLAILVALPYVPWRLPLLHRALFVVLAYEALILLPVIANPTGRALFEYLHRATLVGGSILVGAALVELGALRFALRWFMFGSGFFAVVCIVDTVTKGFDPAYPFGLQKNAAGNILAMAVLLSILASPLLELRRSILLPLQILVVLGLLATQSRGSLLAVLVGFALWTLRGSTRRPSSVVVILLLVVVCAATVSLVNDREVRTIRSDPAAAKFSPEAVRKADYEAALDVWREHPLFGAGLRYFNEPSTAAAEAHNLFIVALAESGLFGVAGLLVLFIGTFTVLARLRSKVATIARLALLVRALTGLVDIFWVAGRMTIPFVLVGAAIAIDAHQRAEAAMDRSSTFV